MITLKGNLSVQVGAIAEAFVFIWFKFKNTIDDKDMLLANGRGNDTLAHIGPWSILMFIAVFSINVFTPSAQVERLLDNFTDGRFCWGFVDVGIASVVIGESAIDGGGSLLDAGCFFEFGKIEYFHFI